MIRFMEEQQVFWLDTPNTSYVIGISDGKYVGHIYYGRRIEAGIFAICSVKKSRRFSLPAMQGRKCLSLTAFLWNIPLEAPGIFVKAALTS